jgi:mannitol-1-/sugar-/sorbitol-6-phosphatase
VIRAQAILFDLDGVLVDSREAIAFVWRDWAARRGVDPEPFIRVAHGRRISETLGLVAPHLDIAAETAKLDALEEAETRGLRAAPGAAELLRLPQERWGIVTSGSRPVATLRLRAAGIVPPQVFVTAEDVRHGKPAPDGYESAAARLAVPPAECVVIEDSPPGVAAGKAAGMSVIAVATTHTRDTLAAANGCVAALADVRVEVTAKGLLLEAEGP